MFWDGNVIPNAYIKVGKFDDFGDYIAHKSHHKALTHVFEQKLFTRNKVKSKEKTQFTEKEHYVEMNGSIQKEVCCIEIKFEKFGMDPENVDVDMGVVDKR